MRFFLISSLKTYEKKLILFQTKKKEKIITCKKGNKK